MSLFTVIKEVENVTLGVIDKDPQFHAELKGLTFSDVFGAIHTVHVHKDGPFKSVEEVLDAFANGTLHAFETHDQASSFERDRGNDEQADKLAALGKSADTTDSGTEGSNA